MKTTFLTLAVLLGNLLEKGELFGPISGPFKIVTQKLDVCEDEGTGEVHFGPKMNSKGNGVFTYNDNVYFLVPWDDSLKADIEVQQLNNGVYRPRYITQSFKNCEKFMKVGKDTAVSFFKAAGYEFKGCPLPVGNYSVKDWPLDIKLNNIPTMIYNSYRAFLSFSKAGKKVGCFIIYADLVPKPQK